MAQIIAGSEVIFRGLRWEVVNSQPQGDQTLYRLRGIDGIVQGNEYDVLSPLEDIQIVSSDFNYDKPASIKDWLLFHQAFLLEQRFGSSSYLAVQPGRLKIEPYQLVPLLRALKMMRARLLLCDDVGLGKTIQAALIITEYMTRRSVRKVLIVSPAGPLLEQWKDELLDRFGLKVDIIDRNKIEEIKRRTELGANPFDHIQLGLISIDFLKQESIMEYLERSLFDAVIIDEAHHCFDLGEVQEFDDSQRRRLAELLSQQADILLLLTATPHNGNDRSFASLIELLDPSLVDGKGKLRGDRYKEHTIRRLKKHIIDPCTREPKFKDRIVKPIPVSATENKYSDYVLFQKSFLEMIAPELRAALLTRRYSDVLSFISLLKRSASSVKACYETLNVVKDRFENFISDATQNQERRKERIKTIKSYTRSLEKYGTLSTEEEEDRDKLLAEDIADQLAAIEKDIRSGVRKIDRYKSIKDQIENIIHNANKAIDCDPKMDILVRQINEIRKSEPEANIIIFTEYTDSQAKIVDRLNQENINGILQLSGGETEKNKKNETEKFRSESNHILVSTDAAAEGLNLQQKCHHLIHFELPFNPNRLEQRNGRIDRYGQEHNPVIQYLYLCGTFEERILLRLIAKFEKQRSVLSFMPNTLGITTSSDTATEKLLKGIIDLDEEQKLFKTDNNSFNFFAPDEDKPISGTQDLLKEIDNSLKKYQDIVRQNIWLGESGLNSEIDLVSKALQVQSQSEDIQHVQLIDFIRSSVLRNGGNLKINGEIITIDVPVSWASVLEGVPGYVSDTKKLKVTQNIDIERDDNDNPIGFLGRVHPIVQKAIESIRVQSHSRTTYIDSRIAAVNGTVSNPTLLFTFIGTVESKKEKVLEKVFGVTVDKNNHIEVFYSPGDWMSFCNIDKNISNSGIWNTHFSSWADDADEKALLALEEKAKSIIAKAQETRLSELMEEERSLNSWFETRIKEATGEVGHGVQIELFGEQRIIESASWKDIADPKTRLAAYLHDSQIPQTTKVKAEVLQRQYDKKLSDIYEYKSFRQASFKPLGVLMIIPEGS